MRRFGFSWRLHAAHPAPRPGRRTLLGGLSLLIAAVLCQADGTQQLEGTILPRLQKPPGREWRTVNIFPASEAQRLRLPVSLALCERIWAADAFRLAGLEQPRFMAVVRVDSGDLYLLLDRDGDQQFSDDELYRWAEPAGGYRTIPLAVPLTAGRFSELPVLLRVPAPDPAAASPLELTVDDAAQMIAEVESSGKRLRFAFEISPAQAPDFLHGRAGVDTNGDGAIDFGPQSPESVKAAGAPPVLRLADEEFSGFSASPDGKTLRLTRRQVVETPIPLAIGNEVPDFEFRDLTGATRRLSDYRGKWLLLDFWGSWCPPCVQDLPALRQTRDRFHEAGFDIVGMTYDNDRAAAARVLAEHQVGWTVADPASVRTLIEKRFGIRSYPLMVLLNPEGKVYAAGDQISSGRLGQILGGIFRPPAVP